LTVSVNSRFKAGGEKETQGLEKPLAGKKHYAKDGIKIIRR